MDDEADERSDWQNLVQSRLCMDMDFVALRSEEVSFEAARRPGATEPWRCHGGTLARVVSRSDKLAALGPCIAKVRSSPLTIRLTGDSSTQGVNTELALWFKPVRRPAFAKPVGAVCSGRTMDTLKLHALIFAYAREEERLPHMAAALHREAAAARVAAARDALRRCLAVVRDVAASIDNLHARGAAHGELTPHHMLGPRAASPEYQDGLLLLTASSLAADGSPIVAGSPKGERPRAPAAGQGLDGETLRWLPRQCAASPASAQTAAGKFDAFCDAYALGATLYALFLGGPPGDSVDSSAMNGSVSGDDAGKGGAHTGGDGATTANHASFRRLQYAAGPLASTIASCLSPSPESRLTARMVSLEVSLALVALEEGACDPNSPEEDASPPPPPRKGDGKGDAMHADALHTLRRLWPAQWRCPPQEASPSSADRALFGFAASEADRHGLSSGLTTGRLSFSSLVVKVRAGTWRAGDELPPQGVRETPAHVASQWGALARVAERARAGVPRRDPGPHERSRRIDCVRRAARRAGLGNGGAADPMADAWDIADSDGESSEGGNDGEADSRALTVPSAGAVAAAAGAGAGAGAGAVAGVGAAAGGASNGAGDDWAELLNSVSPYLGGEGKDVGAGASAGASDDWAELLNSVTPYLISEPDHLAVPVDAGVGELEDCVVDVSRQSPRLSSVAFGGVASWTLVHCRHAPGGRLSATARLAGALHALRTTVSGRARGGTPATGAGAPTSVLGWHRVVLAAREVTLRARGSLAGQLRCIDGGVLSLCTQAAGVACMYLAQADPGSPTTPAATAAARACVEAVAAMLRRDTEDAATGLSPTRLRIIVDQGAPHQLLALASRDSALRRDPITCAHLFAGLRGLLALVRPDTEGEGQGPATNGDGANAQGSMPQSGSGAEGERSAPHSVMAATGLGPDVCNTVVGVMALHRSCSEVVRQGALALAKLCLDPAMHAAASDCGAVAMLTVFLRKETQCLRSDLPHVCCALANVGANDAARHGAVACGTIQLLVATVASELSSPTVALQGVWALRNLTAPGDAAGGTQRAAAEAGAVRTLMEVVRLHGRQSAVVRHACIALRNVTTAPESKAAVQELDPSRTARLICKVITFHGSRSAATRAAVFALAQIHGTDLLKRELETLTSLVSLAPLTRGYDGRDGAGTAVDSMGLVRQDSSAGDAMAALSSLAGTLTGQDTAAQSSNNALFDLVSALGVEQGTQ